MQVGDTDGDGVGILICGNNKNYATSNTEPFIDLIDAKSKINLAGERRWLSLKTEKTKRNN
jgi:hypothetical protein